jgi:hypothetical protein
MSPLAPADASIQMLTARLVPGPDSTDPSGGHACAVPVVDVDHRHAGGTRVEHAEQGREAAERGAVTHARRDSDDRHPDQPADDGWQSAFHAGDDDQHVQLVEAVANGEQAVQPGDADVVDGHGVCTVYDDGQRRFGRDRGVRGACGDDADPAPSGWERAEGRGPGHRVDLGADGGGGVHRLRGSAGSRGPRGRGGARAGW